VLRTLATSCQGHPTSGWLGRLFDVAGGRALGLSLCCFVFSFFVSIDREVGYSLASRRDRLAPGGSFGFKAVGKPGDEFTKVHKGIGIRSEKNGF